MSGEAIFMPMRVETVPIPDSEWELVLNRINRHTLEPLKQEDIFVFSGVCSNDRMDAYLTRMDPETTLNNYVGDLEAGTPLLDNHDIFTSPYGRSYGGQKTDTNEVLSDWYLLRNLTLNGVNSNDQIRAIKAGIKKDMSVGFGGEELFYRCSSCGRDLFDWECEHIPGLKDERNETTFAWIVNGHLREVSTVYRGATPGAYVTKARSMVQQGQLSQNNILLLERRFQVRLDDGKRSIFMPKKEGNQLNLLEQIRAALKDNTVERARIIEIVNEQGEPYRHPEDIAIRNALGEVNTAEGIRQLQADAENGKKYVADLIDQAVAARVKVQGTGFDAEKYKATLVRVADLDFIKEELKSYEDMAKARFTAGRQTEQEDLDNEDLEQVETRSNAPENIFD